MFKLMSSPPKEALAGQVRTDATCREWCWIFNNLANYVERPDNLDSSFDDVISDAGTKKLSYEQKLKYMEALHLNERERTVVYEGGYIMGKEDGLAEGRVVGRAEGEIKGKAEVAKVLKELGDPVDKISKATGLSVEEIKNL